MMSGIDFDVAHFLLVHGIMEIKLKQRMPYAVYPLTSICKPTARGFYAFDECISLVSVRM